MLPISINSYNRVSFVDFGAQLRIAGAKLYELLESTNCFFTQESIKISYAGGEVRQEEKLNTTIDIKIVGRIITLKLTVIPSLTTNHTLLGCDFLDKAKVVLDVYNKQ